MHLTAFYLPSNNCLCLEILTMVVQVSGLLVKSIQWYLRYLHSMEECLVSVLPLIFSSSSLWIHTHSQHAMALVFWHCPKLNSWLQKITCSTLGDCGHSGVNQEMEISHSLYFYPSSPPILSTLMFLKKWQNSKFRQCYYLHIYHIFNQN